MLNVIRRGPGSALERVPRNISCCSGVLYSGRLVSGKIEEVVVEEEEEEEEKEEEEEEEEEVEEEEEEYSFVVLD